MAQLALFSAVNGTAAIDFILDSFHVDGSGLSFVALALESKPKGVHGVTFRAGT